MTRPGDLDKVKRIVKVVGFVNCPAEFTQQPERDAPPRMPGAHLLYGTRQLNAQFGFNCCAQGSHVSAFFRPHSLASTAVDCSARPTFAARRLTTLNAAAG